LWSEKTHLEGAEAVRTWADGALRGRPAVTRNEVGVEGGAAWYVAARPSADGLETLVAEIAEAAGVEPAGPGLHRDVEAGRRCAGDGAADPRRRDASHGQPGVPGLHRDVEAVRRCAEDGTTYLFVLNHAEFDQVVQVSGIDLLRGTDADGAHTVPAGAVAVIRER